MSWLWLLPLPSCERPFPLHHSCMQRSYAGYKQFCASRDAGPSVPSPDCTVALPLALLFSLNGSRPSIPSGGGGDEGRGETKMILISIIVPSFMESLLRPLAGRWPGRGSKPPSQTMFPPRYLSRSENQDTEGGYVTRELLCLPFCFLLFPPFWGILFGRQTK